MIGLEQLIHHTKNTPLRHWSATLPELLADTLKKKHGDSPRWEHALLDLPEIENLTFNLESECKISGHTDQAQLENALRRLMPWRKGPFTLSDVYIDTEWRSDFKWGRVAKHLDLVDKNILDVGCGNGYYGYRMLGKGAKTVVGIDPNWLFLYQFLAIKKYIPEVPIWQLPMTLEEISSELEIFDVTFSMGVFYHRRSPIDHLYQLKDTLKTGGQLVLETIVIDGDENTVLVPDDRYAQMRNVWYLPSVVALTRWMERVGFNNVTCIDVSKTTVDEQRTTDWMTYLSLPDFLDPADSSKTIEGHPAPKRAVMFATK